MTRNPVEHATLPKEKNTRPGISGQQKCSRRLWKPVTMIFFVWLLTLPSPVPCEWASFWGLPGTVLTFPTSIELGQASIFVEKELQRVNREAMADLDGKDIMFKFHRPSPVRIPHWFSKLLRPKQVSARCSYRKP